MSTAVPLSSLLGGIASALIGSLFAGADTALTSLSSTRLSALEEGSTGWMKSALERIQRENAELRSRYLLGRVASTALTSVFAYQIFEPTWAKGAIYLALGVTVLVTSVLFEVSTTLARKHADYAAPAAARYLRLLELAMLPLAVPLSWLGARLAETRDGDVVPSVDPRVTEAEVEHLVDEGEKSGRIAPEPAEMIRNVLDFADRTAKDVMIRRDDVEAIEIATPIEDVLTVVAEGGHSRYPVYRGTIDDVVGLLYAKDLFKAFEEGGTKKALADLVRGPANFVAESRPLSSLLREMRRRRRHLAIVVDELGSVCGIVTLEDVLEEIVGDIRDEHDDKPIEELGDGRIVADADMSMNDLGTYLGQEIGVDDDYESIGAMITQELGKAPEVGDKLTKFGFQFVVRDSDESRVAKVVIEPASGEGSVPLSPEAEP